MKCTKCRTDNAPAKKTCENCGTILSGVTINNVTGQKGVRNPDGSFNLTANEECTARHLKLHNDFMNIPRK